MKANNRKEEKAFHRFYKTVIICEVICEVDIQGIVRLLFTSLCSRNRVLFIKQYC